jgi:hypothetical protein
MENLLETAMNKLLQMFMNKLLQKAMNKLLQKVMNRLLQKAMNTLLQMLMNDLLLKVMVQRATNKLAMMRPSLAARAISWALSLRRLRMRSVRLAVRGRTGQLGKNKRIRRQTTSRSSRADSLGSSHCPEQHKTTRRGAT